MTEKVTVTLTYYRKAREVPDTGAVSDLGITWHTASGSSQDEDQFGIWIDVTSEEKLHLLDAYMKTFGYYKRTSTTKTEDTQEVCI